jgi:hypothetical protein
MGIYICKCPDCGEKIEVGFGDRYFGGHDSRSIQSSLSFHCVNCGSAIEGDDGRLTGDLRVMHLQQEGTWAVKISDLKHRIFVFKVMRELFDLPMSEARALIAAENNIFKIGTKAEAYYAQDRLKFYSVIAEIIRAE